MRKDFLFREFLDRAWEMCVPVNRTRRNPDAIGGAYRGLRPPISEIECPKYFTLGVSDASRNRLGHISRIRVAPAAIASKHIRSAFFDRARPRRLGWPEYRSTRPLPKQRLQTLVALSFSLRHPMIGPTARISHSKPLGFQGNQNSGAGNQGQAARVHPKLNAQVARALPRGNRVKSIKPMDKPKDQSDLFEETVNEIIEYG